MVEFSNHKQLEAFFLREEKIWLINSMRITTSKIEFWQPEHAFFPTSLALVLLGIIGGFSEASSYDFWGKVENGSHSTRMGNFFFISLKVA